MQISPEHRLAVDADKVGDEWLILNDQTAQVFRLSRELLDRLSDALVVADKLEALEGALERGFVRQVTQRVRFAWQLARSLKTMTTAFR